MNSKKHIIFRKHQKREKVLKEKRRNPSKKKIMVAHAEGKLANWQISDFKKDLMLHEIGRYTQLTEESKGLYHKIILCAPDFCIEQMRASFKDGGMRRWRDSFKIMLVKKD